MIFIWSKHAVYESLNGTSYDPFTWVAMHTMFVLSLEPKSISFFLNLFCMQTN
jgi:hypothetical protein